MYEYRSAMFVPGSNEKMLTKAKDLKADLILFDLEDSVRPANKVSARKLVAKTVAELRADEKHVGVRINDLSSGQALADLSAVLPSKPSLIVLPKVESGEDLVKLDAMLGAIEAEIGLTFASIKLIILTAETPASLFQFDSLSNISERLVGMTWGAEDLASELGAAQGRDQAGKWLPPFQLAQTLCLAKARDLNAQALDTVYADIKNLEGLREECIAARQIGFTGKLAIHPAQLDVINEVFSPSEQEVEHAQRLVALFSANPDAGAIEMDGRMMDIPHLRAAERLLARCKN